MEQTCEIHDFECPWYSKWGVCEIPKDHHFCKRKKDSKMKYEIEITGEGSQHLEKILEAFQRSLGGGASTALAVFNQDTTIPKGKGVKSLHWFDGDGNAKFNFKRVDPEKEPKMKNHETTESIDAAIGETEKALGQLYAAKEELKADPPKPEGSWEVQFESNNKPWKTVHIKSCDGQGGYSSGASIDRKMITDASLALIKILAENHNEQIKEFNEIIEGLK